MGQYMYCRYKKVTEIVYAYPAVTHIIDGYLFDFSYAIINVGFKYIKR